MLDIVDVKKLLSNAIHYSLCVPLLAASAHTKKQKSFLDKSLTSPSQLLKATFAPNPFSESTWPV